MVFVWRAPLKSVLAWAENENKQDLYLSTSSHKKSCYSFTLCFSFFQSCYLLNIEYHKSDLILLPDISPFIHLKILFCYGVFLNAVNALRVFFCLLFKSLHGFAFVNLIATLFIGQSNLPAWHACGYIGTDEPLTGCTSLWHTNGWIQVK